jgi:hypothetical protein
MSAVLPQPIPALKFIVLIQAAKDHRPRIGGLPAALELQSEAVIHPCHDLLLRLYNRLQFQRNAFRFGFVCTANAAARLTSSLSIFAGANPPGIPAPPVSSAHTNRSSGSPTTVTKCLSIFVT